jgi:hypothetical protein
MPATERAAAAPRLRASLAHLPDHRLVLAAGVALLAIDLLLIAPRLAPVPIGWDAASYWRLDLETLYASASGSLIAPQGFRYSPAFAQAIAPLGALSWEAFLAVYIAAMLACAAWLAHRSTWLVLILPPVIIELWFGNIHLFLAVAMVGGLRWPALWAFPLLTKVTPGIGVLWFAFRREWRSVWVALGVTGSVVLVSYLLAPDLWREWVSALAQMSALPQPNSLMYPSLALRLPVAIVVLWWGAKRDHRWTVPVAGLMAMPTIWVMSWAVLAGAVALSAHPTKQAVAVATMATSIAVFAWLTVGPAY